ncbi:hypothetical protein ACFLTH_12575 [Bacteroidota bacterium]
MKKGQLPSRTVTYIILIILFLVLVSGGFRIIQTSASNNFRFLKDKLGTETEDEIEEQARYCYLEKDEINNAKNLDCCSYIMEWGTIPASEDDPPNTVNSNLVPNTDGEQMKRIFVARFFYVDFEEGEKNCEYRCGKENLDVKETPVPLEKCKEQLGY